MSRFLLLAAACWLGLLLAHPVFGQVTPPVVEINVGTLEAREFLGFGWSRPEGNRADPRTFTWIKRKEADVWFEMEDVQGDMTLQLTAAPLYINHLKQNVGVYLNGTFIKEWFCPHDADFHTYEAQLPAALFKMGRNRLILRVGYLREVPGDERKLGLAVDRIVLSRVGKAD